MRINWGLFSCLVLLALSACGGGGGGGGVTPTYTVGGAVTGLSGSGLVLQNNAGNDLAITASGNFSFSTALASGAAYAVTIKTQPTGQTCIASNGTGTVGTINVTNVAVACISAPTALSYSSPQTYTVGAAIAALNPTVTGTATSYGVLPTLPVGLVLNTTSGQITGTPTAAVATATYTITAQNSAGSTTFGLSITVNTPVPAAAVVTLGYGIKQVTLNWTAVAGASYYRVMKNPDGASGYTQLGGNLTTTSYADTVAVHLTSWINARYLVQSCNSSGCTDSAAVFALDPKQAIGYFKASNTKAGDDFGQALALSADGATLAVGAPGESSAAKGINGDQADNTGIEAGAVYLYTRSGSTWLQQAYIKASNTDVGDSFGAALALSADGATLAVDAPGESSAAKGINGDQADNTARYAGAVYVYTRSGSTWSQQAYIKASNTGAFDFFGAALALSTDGATLVVGAYGEASAATGINGDQADDTASQSGAVYVYTRSASTWLQQAYIKASNTGAGDGFGAALALSADGATLAVGAYIESSAAKGINGDQADDTASQSGAVYVYTRSASTWLQQAYIKASNTEAADNFGYALALSANGATLAVGAYQESSAAKGINGDQADDTASQSGAVYVYTRSASTWSQQAYIKASNTGAHDFFGAALALSADGATLVVGAYGEASAATGINGDQTDDTASQSGAVYVYTRSASTWLQQAYIKASNTGAADNFGIALALSADGATLAVGADAESSAAKGINGDQADNTANNAGAVYLY